jgi:hypothetical protein
VGLFDLFRSKKDASASPADKWTERALDKRGQAYDRQEAIHALSNLKTKDAAAVLLRRFNFVVDPSITDQEEKDLAFQGIVAAGDEAIEAVRAYAERAESVAWPMKILREIMDADAYRDELLKWLSRHDTEYAKFIDPKLQLLNALQDIQSPAVVEGVMPFLEDVNEAARFNAVSTLLAQGSPETTTAPMLTMFAEEESVRVRARVADGLADAKIAIPEEHRRAVSAKLPDGFWLRDDGFLSKSS